MVLYQGGGGNIGDLRQRIDGGRFQLYGILIYSDVDMNFVEFVKNTHKSLATMSGEKIFLFWFENFPWDSQILWKPGELPANRKPEITRSESLKLARSFGIPMKDTPCILFCKNLEDTEPVVYTFDNKWSNAEMAAHFKEVFDGTEEVLKKSERVPAFNIHDELVQRFMSIEIKKAARRAVSTRSVGDILRAIALGEKLMV